MGDSRGRWEGDTLVIDVTNRNDKTWFDSHGSFHSENLRVTERWTLADPDTLFYEATMDDPTVFTGPWTIALHLRSRQGQRCGSRDMGRLVHRGCTTMTSP